jgi:dTDP-4-amino-4,6-dideoxygalactose transaminase
VTAVRVPFLSVALHEDAAAVRAAVDRVLSSGWFILGPEVEAFEREFAAASGAAHAVGVGTGTDAIALALRALGIGPGDEVVTAPLSAAYTALAIVMAGAQPVFADIDASRLTIDPRAIEAAITPRTRAIVPVHLYGQPADMTTIARVPTRTHWRSSRTVARRISPPVRENRLARSEPAARSAFIRPRTLAHSVMGAHS